MRAILCPRWGGPEVLEVGQVPDPEAGPDQVVLQIRACGLNFGDVLMVAGRYQERPPLPFTPGFEVAGEVLAVGPGVSQYRPGDRVLGLLDYGGLAEQAAADVGRLMPWPDGLDFATGSAFAVAYGTAHLGLAYRARLRAGETLLVHGAAGGVGLAAVAVGRELGATVIATASTSDKLALAGRTGASHLINYVDADFHQAVMELTGGRGVDVVFDPVGGEVFDQSVRCLGLEGRLLVIGFASGRIPELRVNLALVKNIDVIGLYWGAYAGRRPAVLRESLATLAGWLAAGRIRPYVSQTYPLAQAPQALAALANRQTMGKVVVLME